MNKIFSFKILSSIAFLSISRPANADDPNEFVFLKNQLKELQTSVVNLNGVIQESSDSIKSLYELKAKLAEVTFNQMIILKRLENLEKNNLVSNVIPNKEYDPCLDLKNNPNTIKINLPAHNVLYEGILNTVKLEIQKNYLVCSDLKSEKINNKINFFMPVKS